eukprot:7175626-Alexandrium_andersonii.AAC.1
MQASLRALPRARALAQAKARAPNARAQRGHVCGHAPRGHARVRRMRARRCPCHKRDGDRPSSAGTPTRTQ